MRSMDGQVLHEYDMRVGWGKSVPLPAVPLYDGKVRGGGAGGRGRGAFLNAGGWGKSLLLPVVPRYDGKVRGQGRS